MLAETHKRIRWAVVLAGVIAVLCNFAWWWRSLDYSLYATVCDPTKGHPNCPSYNVIAAFVLDGAYDLNYWGVLVTAVATGFIAWFTFSLRDATRQQAKLAERSGDHFTVTERAYVNLSHHPPGIYWENPRIEDLFYGPEKEREYWVRIDIRVKNFGRTPAHITEVCLAYKFAGEDEKLPDVPNYSEGTISPAHAFLVADDEFTHMTRKKIAIEDKTAIWDGNKRLVVCAYVEYYDKFGTHHRGRYARHYEHGPQVPAPISIHTGERLVRTDFIMGINNLIFVDQARYNSDITQRADGSWPDG